MIVIKILVITIFLEVLRMRGCERWYSYQMYAHLFTCTNIVVQYFCARAKSYQMHVYYIQIVQYYLHWQGKEQHYLDGWKFCPLKNNTGCLLIVSASDHVSHAPNALKHDHGAQPQPPWRSNVQKPLRAIVVLRLLRLHSQRKTSHFDHSPRGTMQLDCPSVRHWDYTRHNFCCQSPISNLRPFLNSLAKTTWGMLQLDCPSVGLWDKSITFAAKVQF